MIDGILRICGGKVRHIFIFVEVDIYCLKLKKYL